jgi:hypothetical protein
MADTMRIDSPTPRRLGASDPPKKIGTEIREIIDVAWILRLIAYNGCFER